MSKARIFVTGGTGFIGSHLLTMLAEQGYELTVLMRSTGRSIQPVGRPELPAGIRRVIGDLNYPQSYQQQLIGHQGLIHLAADYRVGIPPSRKAHAQMYRTNVEGTLRLLDQAEKAAIPQIIYISTTAALGETAGEYLTEEHRHNGTFRCYYEETKHIAHSLVSARQKQGAPINIAIPCGVFGPGDNSVLTQTIDTFFRGKIPFQIATSSQFQLCHVSRLCEGIIQLLSPEIKGENYLFTGADFSMPKIFAHLASINQSKILREKSPSSLKFLAKLMDFLAEFGPAMPLSNEALNIMDGSTYIYSSQKAEYKLGWSAGDARQDFLRYATQIYKSTL